MKRKKEECVFLTTSTLEDLGIVVLRAEPRYQFPLRFSFQYNTPYSEHLGQRVDPFIGLVKVLTRLCHIAHLYYNTCNVFTLVFSILVPVGWDFCF